jgi:hypothetical protein
LFSDPGFAHLRRNVKSLMHNKPFEPMPDTAHRFLSSCGGAAQR